MTGTITEGHYLSTAEIQGKLRERGIILSLPAVYRHMQKFTKDGKLERRDIEIEMIGSTKHYSPKILDLFGDIKQRKEPTDTKSIPTIHTTKHIVSTGCGDIVYISRAMESVIAEAKKIAPTDLSVMITGETGTGKELVARYIHENSGRRGNFIPVNCATLKNGLVESELFGHRKGAFTGASYNRMGKLQSADSGTLFLDEVYDIPLEAQEMLLRPLEYEFTGVGSDTERKSNFRLVVATNKDLEVAVEEGRIREDFYYRLPAYTIEIPPLRERPGDIPILAKYFLEKLNSRNGERGRVSREMKKRLMEYHWPGNVRELRKAIENSYYHSENGMLDFEVPNLGTPENLHECTTLDDFYRFAIKRALGLTDGNVLEASKILGISKQTIYRKMERLNISY